MLGSQIAALMPSLFLHLIVTIAFAGGAWYLINQAKPEWKLDWHVPMILGAAFSLYTSATSVIGLYQNQALYRVQMAERAKQESAQQTAQAGGQQQQVDPRLQMKAAFLKDIDTLTGSNEPVTNSIARDFFTKYGSLFTHGDSDRIAYANAVMSIYQCQQLFYEDALATFKSRKVVKSDEREHCEKSDGAFFNREHLIPAEMAKGNSDAIELLAQRKPLPDGTGKSIEVTEDSIRAKMESQMHRIDATKKLFAMIASDGPKPASAK